MKLLYQTDPIFVSSVLDAKILQYVITHRYLWNTPYSARHLSIVYCGRGDKKEQKWDQYNGLDERLFISPV